MKKSGEIWGQAMVIKYLRINQLHPGCPKNPNIDS
jgi:hypothetical protein